MIGEDIFSDFDSNTYTQLFNLELNYRGNEILTDITNFLSELNNETIHYINGSLDKLKIDIESYFKSGVNLEGMKENIETIGREIFFDPSHLKKQIFDYLYYACEPISKLEVAFNEEIDFHDIISENNYYFDEESYNDSFYAAYDELKNKYNKKKEELFNDWFIPKTLTDVLSQQMRDFIEKSYEYIYEKINSLSDITQFEFLNMTFSISEISQEVLNNVAKTLKEQVDNQMITIYNDKLGELKKDVKTHLDKHFETFEKLINYEHEATVTKYRLNSKTDTSLENVKFQEVTKKELFNVLNLFFERVREVYSQTSVTEFLYENQNTAIINHPFKTYFTENMSTAIYNEIINITELSYSRYSIERNKFKQNIKIFYIKAFKRIFSQFVKYKGKDYLDYSLNNDYKKRIYPDFNLMINSMNDTYSFVKVLLNTSELKGLGTILASRFVNIYPEIREKLNLIIPDKVPNIIISSLFVETMEDENRPTENKLSKKVYNLIPKYL